MQRTVQSVENLLETAIQSMAINGSAASRYNLGGVRRSRPRESRSPSTTTPPQQQLDLNWSLS